SGRNPPSSPPEVSRPEECEAALARALAWCADRQHALPQSPQAGEEPHPAVHSDGPEKPGRFWFRGVRYEDLTRRELELLVVLWKNRQSSSYWEMETWRAARQVYGAPSKQEAILSTKRRLSTKLAEQRFPGRLSEVDSRIILRVDP